MDLVFIGVIKHWEDVLTKGDSDLNALWKVLQGDLTKGELN